MREVTSYLKHLRMLWVSFWFESQDAHKLACFRFCFGIFLFCLYVLRTPDLLYYFSEKGILTKSLALELLPMDYRYSIFFQFTSEMALWIGQFVFLASLLVMAFGPGARTTRWGAWVTRGATVVAYVLHLSFLHRNMTQGYGADLISAFFLFYLIFASYHEPRPSEKSTLRTQLSSIALRFLQLQVCVIYAYAGLDKARGPQWWAGEALWGVVANAQLARFDFSIFSYFPLIVVALTYTTLAWEIYFPLAIWVKPLRPWMLAFGVLLHIGIGFTINIVFFSALMIISYILFLDRKWFAKS